MREKKCPAKQGIETCVQIFVRIALLQISEKKCPAKQGIETARNDKSTKN